MTSNSKKKYENEDEVEKDNETKYNYDVNDKKLMRINSKGVIENIENILIEDSKPLKNTNKKNNHCRDNNSNGFIEQLSSFWFINISSVSNISID